MSFWQGFSPRETEGDNERWNENKLHGATCCDKLRPQNDEVKGKEERVHLKGCCVEGRLGGEWLYNNVMNVLYLFGPNTLAHIIAIFRINGKIYVLHIT